FFFLLFFSSASAHHLVLPSFPTRRSSDLGCWHVVSRDFLVGYRHCMNSYSHARSSPTTELYEPKPFFTHAVLLHQACAHCGRFPTAASRRSMDRISVPLWPISLSTRLCIIALVSRYLTN